MMRKIRAALAGLTAATVLITPAAAENVVRWASATEALTSDPHSANHLPTQAENSQVYEPLVDFDSSYEIEPSLAVAWKMTSPTTWEFDLRPSVRFHDGTPFTAHRRWEVFVRGTKIGEVYGATEKAACVRAVLRFKISREDQETLAVRRLRQSTQRAQGLPV
jgi:ABC-type transport system substrate-binding protein